MAESKKRSKFITAKKALLNAEEWLSEAITKKESKPTTLHKKYIVTSRISENIPKTFNLIFVLSLMAVVALKLLFLKYVKDIFNIAHALSYLPLLMVILTSFATVFIVIFIILSLGLPYNLFAVFFCSLIPDFRRIFR